VLPTQSIFPDAALHLRRGIGPNPASSERPELPCSTASLSRLPRSSQLAPPSPQRRAAPPVSLNTTSPSPPRDPRHRALYGGGLARRDHLISLSRSISSKPLPTSALMWTLAPSLLPLWSEPDKEEEDEKQPWSHRWRRRPCRAEAQRSFSSGRSSWPGAVAVSSWRRAGAWRLFSSGKVERGGRFPWDVDCNAWWGALSVEMAAAVFFLKNPVAKQSASLASDSSRIRFLEKHVFYIIVLKKICPKQDQRGAPRQERPRPSRRKKSTTLCGGSHCCPRECAR
jgi:hypothetical protein